MFTTLLPFRQTSYQTDLTPEQIGQRLADTIITGFSIYSPKPYYGDFTAYSFSVRKVSSRFKKQSLGAGVDGTFRAINSKTVVTLSLKPHPVWLVAMALMGFPLALFLFLGIGEFLKTWDIAVIVNSIMPVFLLYGIFWFIFQVQVSSNTQFWEHMLELQVR
jgi:hypothetical protein